MSPQIIILGNRRLADFLLFIASVLLKVYFVASVLLKILREQGRNSGSYLATWKIPSVAEFKTPERDGA